MSRLRTRPPTTATPPQPTLLRQLFPFPIRLPRSLKLPPFLRTFTLTLLYTATPLLYFTRHHFSVYYIHGPSMSPLLSPTFHETGAIDFVLFRRDLRLSDDPTFEGGTGAKSQLERGMVFSFLSPMWGSRFQPHVVVKRIVALEGDTVKPIVRRRTYDAGGRSIHYSVGHSRPSRRDLGPSDVGQTEEPDNVTVPYGHVWVEGINEDDTVDSNEYGPISKSLITGVGTRVVWPPKRWGLIDWKEDWQRSCLDKGRVKLGREDELGMVPFDWAMSWESIPSDDSTALAGSTPSQKV